MGTIAKLILALILVASSAASPALAAKKAAGKPDKAVSGDPLGLLFDGVLTGQYEMKLSDDNSLAFRAGYGGKKWSSYYSYSTFLLGGSYRFWPHLKDIPGGFWSPSADILIMSMKFENPWGSDETGSGFGLGLGAEGGYQHIFDSGFMLEGSLGLEFVLGSLSIGSGAFAVDAPISGFGFYLRAGIGYAWK